MLTSVYTHARVLAASACRPEAAMAALDAVEVRLQCGGKPNFCCALQAATVLARVACVAGAATATVGAIWWIKRCSDQMRPE